MRVQQARLCIYAKDIQRITGKGERYARVLLHKIRKRFNKEEHQLVSIEEFCLFTGLKMEQVQQLLTV